MLTYLLCGLVSLFFYVVILTVIVIYYAKKEGPSRMDELFGPMVGAGFLITFAWPLIDSAVVAVGLGFLISKIFIKSKTT